MPHLYRLDAHASAIAAAAGAQIGRDVWEGVHPSPGQFAPVVTRAGRSGNRVIRPMHWGYPPPGWQPETALLDGETPRWVSTVRNLESPFWIGNLRHSELRCLIPATAFPVWSAAADPQTGKKKLHWFTAASQGVFAIAGIWRDLTDMPVFAMLTTKPNAAIAAINQKAAMPVILGADDYFAWLSDDWKEAQNLVQPYAGRVESTASMGNGIS